MGGVTRMPWRMAAAETSPLHDSKPIKSRDTAKDSFFRFYSNCTVLIATVLASTVATS